MRVTVVQQTSRTNPCGQSVAAGLRHLGHNVTQIHRGQHVTTPIVACWGWRAGAEYRKQGHRVLVMERGYLGNRFEWYSLGWDGLNGAATFPPFTDNGERFRAHHAGLLKPWRKPGTGKHVLLIGQVPGDMSLAGKDLTRWYSGTALLAAERYGLPVRFREHPVALERGYKRSPNYTEPCTGTLGQALADAEVCITYNSNTGVESVLAGVPTVVDNRGSMAWDVAAHRIGEVHTPPRERWAWDLAWRQWRVEEIARGTPFTNLEHLK